MVSGSGRPLRFLVSLVGLWVGARIIFLWPVDVPLLVAETVTPIGVVQAAAAAPVAEATVAPGTVRAAVGGVTPLPYRADARWPRASEPIASSMHVAGKGRAGDTMPAPLGGAVTAMTTLQREAVLVSQSIGPANIPGAPLTPASPLESRWRGSGWLIARGGDVAPFVPQLGGSQAGLRLTYALDREGRVSLAGRVSSALRTRQREAAVGVDWQPTRLPIHLVAEQRIGIEQARGGPSLAVIGGFGPAAIGGGLMLDGYGQAGVIARDGTEGFADGALRMTRTVATAGAVRIDLGLGAWGGAQRGASRLDVGPAASAVVPVAGATIRLSLEWRERLAGQAAPASGPALSIGTDF